MKDKRRCTTKRWDDGLKHFIRCGEYSGAIAGRHSKVLEEICGRTATLRIAQIQKVLYALLRRLHSDTNIVATAMY